MWKGKGLAKWPNEQTNILAERTNKHLGQTNKQTSWPKEQTNKVSSSYVPASYLKGKQKAIVGGQFASIYI